MEFFKDKTARKEIEVERNARYIDWKELFVRQEKIINDLNMLTRELGYEFQDIYARRILNKKEKK